MNAKVIQLLCGFLASMFLCSFVFADDDTEIMNRKSVIGVQQTLSSRQGNAGLVLKGPQNLNEVNSVDSVKQVKAVVQPNKELPKGVIVKHAIAEPISPIQPNKNMEVTIIDEVSGMPVKYVYNGDGTLTRADGKIFRYGKDGELPEIKDAEITYLYDTKGNVAGSYNAGTGEIQRIVAGDDDSIIINADGIRIVSKEAALIEGVSAGSGLTSGAVNPGKVPPQELPSPPVIINKAGSGIILSGGILQIPEENTGIIEGILPKPDLPKVINDQNGNTITVTSEMSVDEGSLKDLS